MGSLFSGVRSSVELALGHHPDALRNLVSLQEKDQSSSCAVDLHGVTSSDVAQSIRRGPRADAGAVDPDRASRVVQWHLHAGVGRAPAPLLEVCERLGVGR
jgi:hypothetical protein